MRQTRVESLDAETREFSSIRRKSTIHVDRRCPRNVTTSCVSRVQTSGPSSDVIAIKFPAWLNVAVVNPGDLIPRRHTACSLTKFQTRTLPSLVVATSTSGSVGWNDIEDTGTSNWGGELPVKQVAPTDWAFLMVSTCNATAGFSLSWTRTDPSIAPMAVKFL